MTYTSLWYMASEPTWEAGSSYKRNMPMLCPSNGDVLATPLPVPAFDSHCGVQTGVAKRALAFDGLCGARTGGGCQNVQ